MASSPDSHLQVSSNGCVVCLVNRPDNFLGGKIMGFSYLWKKFSSDPIFTNILKGFFGPY